jgi:organic radical activating enzyme
MNKIKVAEIFHSLQGEGLYIGVPSVFLRTFGCNFKCRGFGMPDGQYSTEPDDIANGFLKNNPDAKYNELPLAKTGCDSYASWHPKFKSLSPVMDIPKIINEIELARMSNSGMSTNSTGGTHLVITGGEPLLGWQRAYPELLEAVYEKGYKHITFETNGTQPKA